MGLCEKYFAAFSGRILIGPPPQKIRMARPQIFFDRLRRVLLDRFAVISFSSF
jgi:hypothetical protein